MFCPISGCRHKSPCSFEYSLSWLASFVNLMSSLAWKVSFGFADYCKHLAKPQTQFSIHVHLHVCLLVFFLTWLKSYLSTFPETFQVALRTWVDRDYFCLTSFSIIGEPSQSFLKLLNPLQAVSAPRTPQVSTFASCQRASCSFSESRYSSSSYTVPSRMVAGLFTTSAQPLL